MKVKPFVCRTVVLASRFMARPRVFISSTFYDLKQVRSDLERFVKDMGYDPVRHERGHIPYGSKETSAIPASIHAVSVCVPYSVANGSGIAGY